MRSLLKIACDAAEKLNSDMSVADTKTLEDLETLQSQVEGYIESLKEQIKNREEEEED